MNLEPVHCSKCGKVIGRQALEKGAAEFKCKFCHTITLIEGPRSPSLVPDGQGGFIDPRLSSASPV